jgi:hypothetical protein
MMRSVSDKGLCVRTRRSRSQRFAVQRSSARGCTGAHARVALLAQLVHNAERGGRRRGLRRRRRRGRVRSLVVLLRCSLGRSALGRARGGSSCSALLTPAQLRLRLRQRTQLRLPSGQTTRVVKARTSTARHSPCEPPRRAAAAAAALRARACRSAAASGIAMRSSGARRRSLAARRRQARRRYNSGRAKLRHRWTRAQARAGGRRVCASGGAARA